MRNHAHMVQRGTMRALDLIQMEIVKKTKHMRRAGEWEGKKRGTPTQVPTQAMEKALDWRAFGKRVNGRWQVAAYLGLEVRAGPALS